MVTNASGLIFTGGRRKRLDHTAISWISGLVPISLVAAKKRPVEKSLQGK